MLFRALTTCAGRFSFQAGETVDLPETAAADLVAGGALLPLETPVQMAAIPLPEAPAVEDKPIKGKK